jgi:hypothetical protein
LKRFDLSLLCILLVALSGGLLVLFASPWGIGLSPDSIQYIQAARNFNLGVGFSVWGELGYKPLTHFPPLYPLLLAAAASNTASVIAWARGIQALLFAANIATLGWIVWVSSPRRRWLGTMAACVACIALPLLEIHTWAWSEPLFLILSIWGLFLVYRHLEKPDFRMLIGAAGLVALACLTRYVGFAVVLAGSISILLLSRKPFKYRVTDSLIFALISLLPIFTWLYYNALRGGHGTDRYLVYHLLSLAQVKTAIVVFTTWLIPLPLPGRTLFWLAVFLVTVLLTDAYMLWKGKDHGQILRPVAFLSIFILSYLLALVGSLSFFDSSTPIDNRILSPAFAACLLLAFCLAGATLAPGKSWQGLVFFLCFLWVAATYLGQAYLWMNGWRQQGLGYTSYTWVHSDVLDRLRSLALPGPIYSNDPDALYLASAQPALPLPLKYNPFTLQGNNAFSAEMEHMGEKMRDSNGILVIFDTIPQRPYLPTTDEILQSLPLTPSVQAEDGNIYTWNGGF